VSLCGVGVGVNCSGLLGVWAVGVRDVSCIMLDSILLIVVSCSAWVVWMVVAGAPVVGFARAFCMSCRCIRMSSSVFAVGILTLVGN